MTEFVVESVLHNLNSLIQKQLRPFLSFNQDLRRLVVRFTTIKTLLEDAEEKQFSDTDISDWMQKINDAANMVDDIIDECGYEALRSEYPGVKGYLSDKVQCSCLTSFHPKHIVFCYKIAKKMIRISEKLVEIVEEEEKFNLFETGMLMITGRRIEVIEGGRTTSFFCEPRVYGRQQDNNRFLMNWTSNYSEFMDVLSVYRIEGPEGIGKTTFAKLIFNDRGVVDYFELRIWVRSILDFNFKRIIEAILEAAIGCDCEDLDLDTIQKKLQYLLHGKRYLIVLDFDWYRDSVDVDWQRLKSVLACGKKGASILITTPSPMFGRQWDGEIYHKLSVLSDEDSWKLFKQQVFDPNEKIPFELEVIGRDIVQKCGGVPLAAKLIGALLHSTREKKQWLNVNRSNIWNLLEVEGSVRCAMILSYLYLPIRLKKCFAYCAIFSKVETIRKPYLIELWMANGFISADGRLDAEDAGDDVWNELYKRSFFEDIETDEFGNITGFRMHNHVMELATLVAQDVKCLIGGDTRFIYWSNRINHLSDYRRRIELNSIDWQQIKHLRTYLIPNKCSDEISPNVLKCHSLRVLELRLRGELSPSIGDLKHLRYLNLSKSEFKTLPEYLCKLWNLKILKLDYCKYLQKLPDRLIDLKCLEKLSFKGCHKLSSLPPQMGELSSLRSLTSYFVGNERGSLLGELGGMRLRGDLEMKNLGRVKSVKDAMEANMSSKRLKELRLSWERNEETKLGEEAEEILEALQPNTQQLVSLTATGYTGDCFPIWVFSGSLKKLEIERCRELKCLHEALVSMTALQWLRLYDLPNLEYLPDCFHQLSSLCQLAIGFCGKLRSLPSSLRWKKLERLDIYACPALEKQLCHWSRVLRVCEIRVDGCLIHEDSEHRIDGCLTRGRRSWPTLSGSGVDSDEGWGGSSA